MASRLLLPAAAATLFVASSVVQGTPVATTATTTTTGVRRTVGLSSFINTQSLIHAANATGIKWRPPHHGPHHRRAVDWTNCASPDAGVSIEDIFVEPPFSNSGDASLVAFRGVTLYDPPLPGAGRVRITWLGIGIGDDSFVVCEPGQHDPCPYAEGPMEIDFEADLDGAPGGPYTCGNFYFAAAIAAATAAQRTASYRHKGAAFG
jgi:hypothetical protein